MDDQISTQIHDAIYNFLARLIIKSTTPTDIDEAFEQAKRLFIKQVLDIKAYESLMQLAETKHLFLDLALNDI